MVTENRAATKRVAEAQEATRAAAHYHNVEAARAVMAAIEQRLNEDDKMGR
jgi:hypothetical protein